MGQWDEPEVTTPSNLEDEKLIFLLRQSACCEDWNHVAKLVNDRRCGLFVWQSFACIVYFVAVLCEGLPA